MINLRDYGCDRVSDCKEGSVVPKFFGEYISDVMEASDMVTTHGLIRNRLANRVFTDCHVS